MAASEVVYRFIVVVAPAMSSVRFVFLPQCNRFFWFGIVLNDIDFGVHFKESDSTSKPRRDMLRRLPGNIYIYTIYDAREQNGALRSS